MSRKYPAKLLLLGEYTVLSGSQALAVPLSRWQGKWVQVEQKSIEKESPYEQYIDWLRTNDLVTPVIASRMLNDFEEGWRYQSDIPIGFGLGSSGAFAAAVFDRYVHDTNQANPSFLSVLAKMEDYFHGSSSGMDPMVSFTGQAVYKDEKGLFQNVIDTGWPAGFKVYLLDSGMGRTTGSLVRQYKEKLSQEDFRMKVERELIPMVEHAIHFYLSGTGSMLKECLHVISEFQREQFAWLIPDQVKGQWDRLVSDPDVYVKFCGAGGGGYFLVISASERELPGAVELTGVF